jgi:hypothetical protein
MASRMGFPWPWQFSFVVEGIDQEMPSAVERDPAAFQMRDIELEDVMHLLPDLELDRDACPPCASGILPGVIQQTFVGSDLDEERR